MIAVFIVVDSVRLIVSVALVSVGAIVNGAVSYDVCGKLKLTKLAICPETLVDSDPPAPIARRPASTPASQAC
ncbi:hypothetical protein [Sphingomonas sp. CFBP 8764]|uniref:hypothetical protein n=1 Tax=Sphingomonas sp. CFBP 8764 TaxID=2775275 RepID=UPI001FD04E3E|nr:hypothetical protein [Sphingomonas sp. CFBP 8764]